MKISVTGGAGFIDSHFVDVLADKHKTLFLIAWRDIRDIEEFNFPLLISLYPHKVKKKANARRRVVFGHLVTKDSERSRDRLHRHFHRDGAWLFIKNGHSKAIRLK